MSSLFIFILDGGIWGHFSTLRRRIHGQRWKTRRESRIKSIGRRPRSHGYSAHKIESGRLWCLDRPTGPNNVTYVSPILSWLLKSPCKMFKQIWYSTTFTLQKVSSRTFWCSPTWADWALGLLHSRPLHTLGVPFTCRVGCSGSWIPRLPLSWFTLLFWWTESSSNFLTKSAGRISQMPSVPCPFCLGTYHTHAF